jgi:hypothetical protein
MGRVSIEGKRRRRIGWRPPAATSEAHGRQATFDPKHSSTEITRRVEEAMNSRESAAGAPHGPRPTGGEPTSDATHNIGPSRLSGRVAAAKIDLDGRTGERASTGRRRRTSGPRTTGHGPRATGQQQQQQQQQQQKQQKQQKQ